MRDPEFVAAFVKIGPEGLPLQGTYFMMKENIEGDRNGDCP